MIAAQKPMEWGKYRFGKKAEETKTDALVHYDEEKLSDAISALSCMDQENMREPQDARISDYSAGSATRF